MSAEQYIIFRRTEPEETPFDGDTAIWQQVATVMPGKSYYGAQDVLEQGLVDNPDWGEGEYYVVPVGYGIAKRLTAKARVEYDVEEIEESEAVTA